MRHERRLAGAEEARQNGDGQRALARRVHRLGRGLDGFEQVRVLALLLALRVGAVRMGMAVGHFSPLSTVLGC